MPRFYFHLYNDLETCDEEGRILPDVETARRAAVEDARNMAAESVRTGQLELSHFIEVVGEEGQPLLRVTFGEAIEIK